MAAVEKIRSHQRSSSITGSPLDMAAHKKKASSIWGSLGRSSLGRRKLSIDGWVYHCSTCLSVYYTLQELPEGQYIYLTTPIDGKVLQPGTPVGGFCDKCLDKEIASHKLLLDDIMTILRTKGIQYNASREAAVKTLQIRLDLLHASRDMVLDASMATSIKRRDSCVETREGVMNFSNTFRMVK